MAITAATAMKRVASVRGNIVLHCVTWDLSQRLECLEESLKINDSVDELRNLDDDCVASNFDNLQYSRKVRAADEVRCKQVAAVTPTRSYSCHCRCFGKMFVEIARQE